MITVRETSTEGNARVFARLEGAERLTRRAARQAWFRLGAFLRDSASREILRKPKGGRTYLVRLGGRLVRHRASAPGETHANLSGRARRSLGFKIQGIDTLEFGYGVSVRGSNAAPEYGRFLEFGTSRMAPRPSLGNAVDGADAAARDFFLRALNGEFA